MKVKEQFLQFDSFSARSGVDVHFWEDRWVGNMSLREQFPTLYHITRKQHAIVAEVFGTPLNISFRRSLVGPTLVVWSALLAQVAGHHSSPGRDVFTWTLHRSGTFTVNSMYSALSDVNFQFRSKHIWKLKIHLKIKIFLWYLCRGIILTKDNLVKRN